MSKTVKQPALPSRTYTLAAGGLGALSLLSLGTLLVAFLEPTALVPLGGAIGSLAMAIAAVSGGGAGAMAARDYASRGLTSSQGAMVLASQRMGNGPQPQPQPHPEQLGLPATFQPEPREDAPEDLA